LSKWTSSSWTVYCRCSKISCSSRYVYIYIYIYIYIYTYIYICDHGFTHILIYIHVYRIYHNRYRVVVGISPSDFPLHAQQWINIYLYIYISYIHIYRYIYIYIYNSGCTITVTVWWSVLVPVISHYMPDNESRRKFWIFNQSFPLLNLHLFNLPLCFIEFIYTNKCLVYYDLWVALVIAFIYMMFYLNVLDRNGLHFYIVFTPRHVWCIIPYTIILFSYYGIYHFWNSIISYTSNKLCI
jgi:hypothetical protein